LTVLSSPIIVPCDGAEMSTAYLGISLCMVISTFGDIYLLKITHVAKHLISLVFSYMHRPVNKIAQVGLHELVLLKKTLRDVAVDIGSGRQDAGDDAGFDSPNCLDQCRTQQRELTCHVPHRLFLLLRAYQHYQM
jgi:hypothetical protein